MIIKFENKLVYIIGKKKDNRIQNAFRELNDFIENGQQRKKKDSKIISFPEDQSYILFNIMKNEILYIKGIEETFKVQIKLNKNCITVSGFEKYAENAYKTLINYLS